MTTHADSVAVVSAAAVAECRRAVAAAAATARAVVHRAAGPTTGGATDPERGVLMREALAEALVESRAAGAAEQLLTRLPDGPARTGASVALAWQLPRHVAAMHGEIALTAPVAASPAGAGPEVNEAVADLMVRGAAQAALGVVTSVAEQACDVLPDLGEALRDAAGRLSRALAVEWAQEGEVRLAGMPHLLIPLGEVLCAAALVSDALAPGAAATSAVTARRYLYRHLRSVAPEGLTDRHLARTAELVAEIRVSGVPQ